MNTPVSGAAILLLLGGVLLIGCNSPVDSGDPPPPPVQPFTALQLQKSGLTNASMLGAFEDQFERVWAVGSAGRLMMRDGGQWTGAQLPTTAIGSAVWGSGNHLYVTAGHTLYQLLGDNWTPIALPVDRELLEVTGVGDDLFVTGTHGTIVRRRDGIWQAANTGVSAEVWALTGVTGDLVAVGQSGLVLESDDGLEWTTAEPVTNSVLFGVAHDGAGRVVAVGGDGTVLVRQSGQGWQKVTVPTTDHLFDVQASGPGEFTIVGNHGTILNGDGLSFIQAAVAGARENLRAITGSPGSRVAVGWAGTVLDEEADWGTAVAGGFLYAVHTPGNGNAIAVGAGGLAYERDLGFWRPISIGAQASLTGIAGPSADLRIAVGDSATVLLLSNGLWQPQDVPGAGLMRAVWFDGERAMIVGEAGQAFTYINGVWQSSPTGSDQFIRHIWGTDWQNLWAVGDNGTVLRFDGSEWQPITTAVATILRGVWGTASDDVWIVGDDGIVMHWDGVTLALRESPTQFDLRAVHGVAGVIYVAGELGQMFSFKDGAWTPIDFGVPVFLLGLGGENELVAVGEVGVIAEATRAAVSGASRLQSGLPALVAPPAGPVISRSPGRLPVRPSAPPQ